jgi:hypothetical protein
MSQELWINYIAPAVIVGIGLAGVWIHGIWWRREQAEIDAARARGE